MGKDGAALVYSPTVKCIVSETSDSPRQKQMYCLLGCDRSRTLTESSEPCVGVVFSDTSEFLVRLVDLLTVSTAAPFVSIRSDVVMDCVVIREAAAHRTFSCQYTLTRNE